MNVFMAKLDDLWWDESAHSKHGGQMSYVEILSHTSVKFINRPILIEKIPGPNGAAFKVRNGRHRVLAAIYMRRNFILARFIEPGDGEVQEPE